MLRRIKLLCGLSGVSWAYGPGAILNVPEQIDHATAVRLVADGAAVPVAADKEAPPAPPVPAIETQTIEPPEAAVLPPTRRKKGSRR